MRGHIHDLIAQREELPSQRNLGEEIGIVRVSADKGDTNEVILDAFAYEEVAASNVLHAAEVLRVVRHINRRSIVHAHGFGCFVVL